MEDLDFLYSLSLFLLCQASEVELQMAKDAFSAKFENLANLLLRYDFLEEALLQAFLQLFVTAGQTVVHVNFHGKQVEGLPKNMQKVSDTFVIFNVKILLDEYEVVDVFRLDAGFDFR